MFRKRHSCLVALFVASTIAATAHAESGMGVNMYLQKVWWQADPPNPSNFEALATENKQRLDAAAKDGFKLIRVMFKTTLVQPDVPAAQRESTLRLMSAFVQDANSRGITVFVALAGDGVSGIQNLICNQQAALSQTVMSVTEALPDTPLAGIEPLNEPPSDCSGQSGKGAWNAVQQNLYRQIRSRRPHLFFIASGGAWGSLDGLLKFDPAPYRSDPAVLFTYHYYQPFLFTHQGAGWLSPGHYKYVRDLPWPYEAAAVQASQAAALQRLANDNAVDEGKRADFKTHLTADYADYRETGTIAYARMKFDQARDWGMKNGIPAGRVFVGEFGVLRSTKDTTGSPRPDAGAWIGGIAKEAKNHGFVWALFDLDTAFAVDCGKLPDEKLCSDYRSSLD